MVLSAISYLVSNPFSVAFWLGVLTPLTASCVLPLYPGFLSYLSRQLSGEEERKTVFLFGLITVAGVIASMMLIGLVFTTLLEISLSSSIAVITPVVMCLMGIIGILLMLDFNLESYIPGKNAPESDNPLVNAFGFGFFFGGVVLPCSPGFIALLFARSALFDTPTTNILRFTAFGLGIGFPLLVFSAVSARWSNQVIGVLNRYSTGINRFTGFILFFIALYYLSCQFAVIPLPIGACGYLDLLIPQ